MTGSPIEPTAALVVVDMQNGFVGTDEAPAVDGAKEVVAAANDWVAHAVANNWPRFYTRDVAPFDDADAHVVALSDRVEVDGAVVDKGPGRLGGFSGFVLTATAQPDGLPGDGGLSDLAAGLRAHHVTNVVVVGLAGDVCVSATARDARRLGLSVTVPTRATAFVHAHPDGDEAAWDALREAGVTVFDQGPGEFVDDRSQDRRSDEGTTTSGVRDLVDGSRPRFTPAPDWTTEQLDLPAYLDLIGHDGPVEPTRDVLDTVYAGHRRQVPFTNVTGLLGEDVALDLGAVQQRLVGGRRGGWCLEHVVLFAAVLERLGLPTWRVTGRVQPDASSARPRTHAAVVTHVEGTDLLCDIGFGVGVLAPMPLVEGVHDQGAWSFRLDRRGDQWRLSSRGADGWQPLHVLTIDHVEPSDLDLANHHVATAPRSPFTGRLVAMRTDEEARLRLVGTTRVREYADGREESTELGPDGTLDALRDELGVMLSGAERERLRPRLSAPAT